jgi:small multidrug resistance pump
MVGVFALLFLAIGIEVASTAALPRTEGFRDPGWTVFVLAGYAASIWLLAVVVRQIPVSVAYAVWSGLGTAAIAVIGATLLGEEWDLVKVVSLLLIIGGVVMLNLNAAH